MNETFSRAVTDLVSVHLVPRRSTDSLIRFLYLSSCSSGGGRRLLHSSTTRFLAFVVDDLSFSRCRRTRSLWAASLFCHFSNPWGRAILSRKSKIVRRSSGGNISQSSCALLASVKEGTRESSSGLGGENESEGVSTPDSGEPPPRDDVEDSSTRLGDKFDEMFSPERTGSDVAFLASFGSAIPSVLP